MRESDSNDSLRTGVVILDSATSLNVPLGGGCRSLELVQCADRKLGEDRADEGLPRVFSLGQVQDKRKTRCVRWRELPRCLYDTHTHGRVVARSIKVRAEARSEGAGGIL